MALKYMLKTFHDAKIPIISNYPSFLDFLILLHSEYNFE